MFRKYASVILDLSLDKALDYGVPECFVEQISRGVRVEVPVRGHRRFGYILEIKDSSNFPSVKPISKVVSNGELIPADLFELALWIAKYYCTPLGHVLRMMVPSDIRQNKKPKQQLYVMRAKTRDELQGFCASIRSKSPAQAAVLDEMLQITKGILLSELLERTKGSRSPVDTLIKNGFLSIDIVRIDRSPLIKEDYFKTKPKKLNPDQAQALGKITSSLSENRYETHLLYGVTGSGKTEVYLQAIEHALSQNKGCLMLVPEIALTAQTIERFRSRFEGRIAILHYRLSNGERFDEWNKIHRGEASIVIGARSAIFSPIRNLGLIIIDEEHENSYKQNDEMPCYNARDVAVMRGKMGHATVVLGSATPSLESFHNAQQGKYNLSPLSIRADSASMPQVVIVDMKNEFEKANGYTNFSEILLDGIKKRQELGEQTILFLNRRGYHTTLLCKQCSTSVSCQQCDIALTFHLSENALSCHLCGYTLSPPPKCCPLCKSPDPMKYKGVGTEQIERSLHAILPDIRTLRIDADTTRHKGSHQQLLRSFGTGKADVLIGTQMVAKGLHFPQVTLVGVLNSDGSLNIPDFRASETVFQLITQVSGRAGRGAIAGEVIIQTCMPENNTIQLAAKQDYLAFFNEELQTRQLFGYPPFKHLVKVAISGEDPKITVEVSERIRQQLSEKLPQTFELFPTVPAGYAKVKNRYRFQFLVRGSNVMAVNHGLEAILQQMKYPKDIKIRIDVNPLSTFF